MAKKLVFFTNEQALIFVAKVNGRYEHRNHYLRAMIRTDISNVELAWLSKEVKRLNYEIEQLKGE